MSRWTRGGLLLVFVVAAVMLVPPNSAVSVGGAPTAHALTPLEITPRSASALTGPAASRGPVATSTHGEQVLAALEAEHAPMSKVFLPNFNAHVTVANGTISPLYGESPAPMGLGDFGLADVNGTTVGTISYTNSVEGALTLNSITPMYLDAAGPDQFTVQLNTVLNNVDLLGNLSNEFWIQNVPVYYASSGTLAFEDNIWNFSSPGTHFDSSSIYSHGPGGFIIPNEVYIGVGPAFHVPMPFTVRVYNNATVYNDRPTIWFNYSVTTSNGSTFSGSYDYAEFNSTGNALPTGPAPMPTFQINGEFANPTGFLINDAEIMLGGPGGGSTTSIYDINATMNLWLQSNATGRYNPVPSAFDFGTDTGETSEGIAEWASGGANPTAHLGPGPSILYPLWGLPGAHFGQTRIDVHLTPSNAFVFGNAGSSFDQNTAGWAPVRPSGSTTFSLAPGTYSFKVLLSEYQPQTLLGIGNSTQTIVLHRAAHLGIYTPLWAWGNGQLAAISSGGNGSITNPFTLFGGGGRPINALFGEFNDYEYPVFQGVQLINTTAFVTIADQPSYSITYSLLQERTDLSTLGEPATNFLGYNFYGVRHASIVDNNQISGWVFADDGSATMASMVFWNSSDNLIAANTFDVMSVGVILFGGTQNTVWDNVFTGTTPVANSTATVLNYGFQWSIELYESNDLIYNNAFETPITAYTPTVNIYNGAPSVYRDHWNVVPQAASHVRTVNGFSLSGSILGLTWQGGNYWVNYGNPSAPFGSPYHQLPYRNGGLITVGGDYAPLTPQPVYAVLFVEHGLPATTSWSVTFNGLTETTTGNALIFWQLNGTYAYTVGAVTGYTASPSSGAVTIAGVNQMVKITWT